MTFNDTPGTSSPPIPSDDQLVQAHAACVRLVLEYEAGTEILRHAQACVKNRPRTSDALTETAEKHGVDHMPTTFPTDYEICDSILDYLYKLDAAYFECRTMLKGVGHSFARVSEKTGVLYETIYGLYHAKPVQYTLWRLLAVPDRARAYLMRSDVPRDTVVHALAANTPYWVWGALAVGDEQFGPFDARAIIAGMKQELARARSANALELVSRPTGTHTELRPSPAPEVLAGAPLAGSCTNSPGCRLKSW